MTLMVTSQLFDTLQTQKQEQKQQSYSKKTLCVQTKHQKRPL